MSVSIITDSAASLPPEAAERLGIMVVPMTVVLGGMVRRDGSVTPEEVLERAIHYRVTTSSPSAGDFMKAIAIATERVQPTAPVLVLTLSSAMSSTHQAALAAAKNVEDTEIRVIDTGTAAGAQGLVVMAAAELARSGATLDEVAARASDITRGVRLVASVQNLEHLAASGRVPQVAAFAGRFLGQWPMFEFRAGGVRARRPAQSEREALTRMVGSMLESRRGGAEGSLHAAIMDAHAPEAAGRLRSMVTAAVPTVDLFEAPFSSVMIAHTGPGLVGLAWYWDQDHRDFGRDG
jgi:DegV family protein with EDD domain